MDLQQQQTTTRTTDNPQAATQPDLASGKANLQPTAQKNVNQLVGNEVRVNAACTTACSGSIPPPTNTPSQASNISGSTWLVIAVGIVVALAVGWIFRSLMAPKQ